MAFAWRIIREYIRAFKTWRILSSYIEPFDRGSKRLGIHSFGFENIFIHTKCTKFFLPYKLSVILDRSQRRNRVSLNKLCANNRSPLLESCRACTSSTLFASYRQKREKKERMKKKKVITGSFKETRTKKERREKDRVGVDREVDERKRE